MYGHLLVRGSHDRRDLSDMNAQQSVRQRENMSNLTAMVVI